MLKKHLTILSLLAIVFFFIYSYLNFQIPLNPPLIKGETEGDLIFNSPDETSAYFFSRLFADSPTKLQNGYENLESGGLSKLESLNFLAPGLIHPRSVLVNSAGYLVPGGFLGMPLVYGSLAKIVQRLSLLGRLSLDISLLIPFFTPFFAVLGVLAFYFLIRKVFDENIAFLSSVLMFFLPPFWYYSTRGMFHNVFFAVCLVFSACFFFAIPFKKNRHPEPVEGTHTFHDEHEISPLAALGRNDEIGKKFYEYVRYCGGGLFLGLALITRTSEIVWLGILGLALAIYFMLCHSEPTHQSKARCGVSLREESRGSPDEIGTTRAVRGSLALPRDSSSFRQVGTPQNDRWKIYWPAAILGFAVLCATFLPVLYQNQMLYGSAFKFGYNISAVQNINQTVESSPSILPPNHTEQNPAGEQAPYGAGTEQHGNHPHLTSPSPREGEEGGGGKVQRSSAMEKIFSVVQRGKSLLLPFGIHPRAVWNNFWNYFIKLFWWFTIPMILGCLIFLYQNFRVILRSHPRSSAIRSLFLSPQILYFASFVLVSVWLFFYYGSWQVFDNINFQKITIGNSYLRYWLPIFIMGLPFAVLFLKNVVATFRLRLRSDKSRAATILVLGFLCFSVFMSALVVFAGEDEGIFYVKNNLLRYNEIRLEVLKLTPPTPPYSDFSVGTGGEWGGAIIITERSDKIFFPERRIIVWKRGEALDENFKNLSKFIPIYYYNVAFTGEESKVFNKELKKMGLKIDLIKLFGNEGLYKIILIIPNYSN